MTIDKEAFELERQILGGEPFYYACGCVGVVTQIHTHNADWVHIKRIHFCAERREERASKGHIFVPPGHVPFWRTRSGKFISEEEWFKHTEMSEQVYGR